MPTTLLELPSELIASIIAFLDDTDVFSSRLASRHIEASSLSHFGHRFFRKKGYMLTSPSLTVLRRVSEHSELRKYVQHVWFNPDCFTFVHPECAPDAEECPDPDEPDSILKLLSPADRRMFEAYEACMEDHTQLLAKSATKLEEILTEIFANLPELKILGMRRSEDHAPCGWRQLKDAVGEDPRVLGPIPSGPMYFLSGPTRLFLAIVKAVAATDVKLRRFYTDAIEIDNIRPDLLPQEALEKACSPIWYLEVNVTKAWLNKRKNADYIQLTDQNEYGDGLVRLLKATTNLKEIGLQIFPDRKQSHILAPSYRNPESWRESYPYLCLEKIVANIQLPHLSRIKLEKVTTSPATLLGFLRPSQDNMRSLKIRDVRLLSDEEHPYPWRKIFQFLLDDCPKLDYILFYHLLYESGGISFVKDPPMPLPPPETDPTTGAPNPQFGGGVSIDDGDFEGPDQDGGGEEFFMKYEHIALQVSGREQVVGRLERVVEEHWYHKPIFSYHMDEGLWHTDTSDEEW